MDKGKGVKNPKRRGRHVSMVPCPGVTRSPRAARTRTVRRRQATTRSIEKVRLRSYLRLDGSGARKWEGAPICNSVNSNFVLSQLIRYELIDHNSG